MEGLFRQIGIYSPHGQQYTPQDRDIVSYYKEDKQGQVLQDGINELGAMSSWLAAATSYSTNDCPMIPFYIYYSMFGFQRIGDMAGRLATSKPVASCSARPPVVPRSTAKVAARRWSQPHPGQHHPELHLLRPVLRL